MYSHQRLVEKVDQEALRGSELFEPIGTELQLVNGRDVGETHMLRAHQSERESVNQSSTEINALVKHLGNRGIPRRASCPVAG